MSLTLALQYIYYRLSLFMMLNVKKLMATRIPIDASDAIVPYSHMGIVTSSTVTYVESRGIWPSTCKKIKRYYTHNIGLINSHDEMCQFKTIFGSK